MMIERARKLLAFGFVLGLLGASAYASDPQIAAYTDDPDPVPAGGVFTLTAIIDNNAIQAAANTRLTVPVPSGAEFVSAPAGCSLLPPAPPLAQRVECLLGTLGGSGADVRTIPIRFRALGPSLAPIVSQATVTADNDTNPTNNTQGQTTSVVSGANLALAKSGSPDPVVGGSNVTYTLTASSTGPNNSGTLQIVDDLPPSVSFVSASGSNWTCGAPVGQRITCTHPGGLTPGTSAPPLTIVGTVNASGGTVTNTASVAPGTAGGVADPDTSNNTASVNTAVLPGADVRIAGKTVSSGTPAVAGANVSFVIQPRNAGPAAAVNAVVTDPLPAGWTFVSASGAPWTCGHAAGTVTCSRASLPVGASENITIVATAPDNAAVGATGSTYTNTASIASASADPIPGNNSGSVNVQVLPDGADLRLAKSKGPNPVAQGSPLVSQFIVTNNGPRAATGPLRVVEVLAGETYLFNSGTGWTCTPNGAVVVCEHPNTGGLAVGASLPTLFIRTTATDPGVLSNTACTGNSVPPGSGGATPRPPNEGDANPTNDCSTSSANSTTVRPDLAIAKLTSTPTGGDKLVSASESFVDFTLTVTNVTSPPNTDVATGVRIVDDVPSGLFIPGRTTITAQVLSVTGTTPATFSCAVNGARVTCNQTGGQFAPGDEATIRVRVTRPFNDGGPFTNTASVSNTVEGDPNATNNSASDTVTVEPIADIEMTGKTVTPNPLRAGENATYTLSFRNNGPSAAQNVVLNDGFAFPVGDSGVTVVAIASSKAGSSCSIAAGAVLAPAPGNSSFSCTIGSLANGETQSVTLTVRPNFQPGNGTRTFNNTASVSTSTVENPAGGDNGNNSRSAALTVNPAAVDLVTNKADVFGGVVVDPVPYFTSGGVMSYAVRVTNNGPSFATDVRIAENMVPPAGRRVQFVCDTASFNSATCNAVTLCPGASTAPSGAGAAIPTFRCSVPAGNATTGPNVGDLAPGQSKTIFLRFLALDQPAPRGDVFTNSATAESAEPDTQPANNSENEQTTTRQRVDLRVTKTASAPTVSLLEPFNWIVTVENRGPGNSLQTDLTDTLPVGAEVTGPVTWTRSLQPGSGSCSVANRTVSCALGQLDGAALPNPGTATITIPVRFTSFPTGGTATNSATVDTDPDKIGGIDTPGGNNTGTHVINVVRASIAGTVFQDRLRDAANGGTPQAAASEPRIAGVRLRLTGTDAWGNAVDRQVDSDANGNYLFDNLSPAGAGGYTVTQTQPAGFVNGPVDPPVPAVGGGAYAAGGAGGNSVWSGIAPAAGANLVNYNFPEVRRPSLSGRVYVDVDGNNAYSAGDTDIAGASVVLRRADTGAQVAATTTNAQGGYTFADLDPLVAYVVEEPLPTAPANLANGPVNPGLIGGLACASGCTAQADTPTAGTDRIAAIDLGAGTDGTQFNFGEIQLASISGLIWVDSNRDGVLQVGETGRLGGESVRLVQGADCTSGATLQTTTTLPDGSYRFDGVRAFRDYLVCETQPLGYGTGSALGVAGSNSIPVTNLPTSGSANNNFGETLATLAGSVYQDTGAGNPGNFDNGQRDAGELGIPGVRITLSGTDARGNPVNRFVDTAADGSWSFGDLLAPNASGYTVSEGPIPPAAGSFIDGRDTAGSAGGSAAVNDVVSGIAVPAGGDATGYLFGELPLTAIAGTVYIDRDRDGALDAVPTDGRIPGVTLRLVQGASCAAGTTLASTTTDADGRYRFDNVRAGGSYLVCETQPAGYGNGSENPGAGATTPGTNVIAIASLPAEGSLDNHFGERLAQLSGSVYADYSPNALAQNNNGQRDAGESGIAGVPVTLTGRDVNGNAVSRSTTTDNDGNWRFDDLLQSDAAGYTVVEGTIPPAAGLFNDGRETVGDRGGNATAANDQISGIVLAAGDAGAAYLFGELPIVPIGGTVYIDRDRDNTVDATPTDGRIPGVTIRLVLGTDCSGTEAFRTQTDATGNYLFSGASAGLTYTVCQLQPVGYLDGGVNPGTAGSSGAANSITIANVPLQGSPGNHFGERVGSIAGSVFHDVANDGARQGADTGLAGVSFTLSGTDAAGNAVSRVVQSDANGNWRFDDLLAAGPGGYTVTQQAAQPLFNGSATINGRTTAGNVAGATLGSGTAVAVVPSAIAGIALAAGADSVDNLFAEIRPVSLAGTVFIDVNNNGLQEAPADAGLANVALTITGIDDTGASVTRNIVTGADGRYNVADLRPGTYTVTEPQQPAGTTNGQTLAGSAGGTATAPGTLPSAISGIVLTTPGAASIDNNFAEIPNVGSISGRVWLDADNNGQIGAGEPGIAGVTIELTGTNTLGNPVNRQTTTDANGNWSFDGLSPGTYAVREPQQPPNTANGSTVPGNRGGTATGAGTAPSAIAGIVLGVGESSQGNNFGEIPLGTISGRVYADVDDNGQVGTNEPGLANVTVVLTGTDDLGNPVNVQVQTGPDGRYSFPGLRPGTYVVTEPTQPPGTRNGITTAGSAGGNATNTAGLPSTISQIVLGPGVQSVDNNFGEVPNNSALSGRVWLDTNNNGLIDGTEAGIAGVPVQLSGTDGAGRPVNLNTVTDANGSYAFTLLSPGTYTVTEPTQPAGTLNGTTVVGDRGGSATAPAVPVSAVSGIVLGIGQASVANNFGEVPPAEIAGRVYADNNNNGVVDANETGLSGVTIVLTGTDDLGNPVNVQVQTGPDGRYAFPGLRPGTYTLTQPTQPLGTVNGIATPGSSGGTATPVGTVPSAIGQIVLAPGARSIDNNFGEIQSGAAIGGRVWLDANNNGLIDGTEAGIAGVTVELTGTDAANRPVARQTVTDAGGNYAFNDLPPGTYAVREPQQPVGTVNGVTRAGNTGGTATAPATTPSAITAIPLAANQISSANDFGEVPTAEISGTVYADNNNNGVVDGGETGLAGVTLVLTGTDDLGNPVNIQATTGPDGRYSFPDLRPGTYTITQPAQPGGTINGITSAGSAGGNATPVGTVPSAITQIVLGPGARSTGNNFGEITESPDLRVSKRLEGVDRFTVGFIGRYTVSVRNAGNAPTAGVYTVRDRLPVGLTLAGAPTGTGWSCTGAANDSRFDCTSSAVIVAGANAAGTIDVPVNVAAAAAANSPVNNLVLVEGGGEIPVRAPSPAERAAFDSGDFNALPVCTATIEHNACRVPTPVQLPAAISGTVWFDGGASARVLDAGDRRLAGWQVEIVDPATNQIVGRATTGADGRYRVEGLLPGLALAVRFREPGSGIVYGYPVNGDTAPGSSGASCNPQAGANGTASSCVGAGANPALTVILAPGQELQQQSLPVDPSGVVYDSGTRQPVPGSIVTLAPVGACPAWDPATGLVGATLGGYTVNGPATSMTVGNDGFYQFLFSPNAPASCTFGITVTPPSGYSFQSTAIPPTPGPLNAPGGPTAVFPVQPQAAAPSGPVGTATTYYLSLVSGSAGANVIHNHIPLDPLLPAAIGLTKTGDKSVAEIGDSVRYTITVSVLSGALPRQTTVVDRLPAGFTYIPGTAMVGEQRIADPQGGLGPRLAFNLGAMGPGNTLVLRYRVRVGVGAASGDGINSARAHACSAPAGCVDGSFNPLAGSVATNEARHRVRVEGGVFGTEACVLGKIFVDCNHNQVQDREELGIPGVRLVMQDGTTLISDSEGKYSLCGLPPRSAVLRVDPSTLPRGSRLVTTSNRNLGDAGSLWLDLKSGELHRADFAEGSCNNTVLEQVKARRAQGEVRAPENEREGRPALRFDSKAHGLDTFTSPQQGTDGANQQAPKPRAPSREPAGPAKDESNPPTPALPQNRPPPRGRESGQAANEPNAAPASSAAQGGAR
jgi:uncharacterized repeat protein (TIGR01451 family)